LLFGGAGERVGEVVRSALTSKEEVAVLHRIFCPAAIAAWISLTGAAVAQKADTSPLQSNAPTSEPGRLALEPAADLATTAATTNQRVADAIAERLQRSGQLRGYRVDIRFSAGVAELHGQVADAAQRVEVLRIASSVAGVDKVCDLLETAAGGVVPAAQAPIMEQGPVTERLLPQMVMPQTPQMPSAGGEQGPFSPAGRSHQPLIGGSIEGAVGAPQEPVSIMPGVDPGMGGPGMGGLGMQPPLPPYAWPTYAPYNNYSRVAYPTLYNHDAFPFIGPVYPFPKIPLGWRAVTLQWMDGYWWYGRHATGHDWWRIRYY
jgi:hypothetical protein